MSENREGARSFALFLQQLADGDAHSELSQELHKLNGHCQRESKARGQSVTGSLSLALTLKYEPNGIVGIGYKVQRKEPSPTRQGSVFFLTEGGNLSVDNPRQQKLPLKEVGGEEPVRSLPAEDRSVKGA